MTEHMDGRYYAKGDTIWKAPKRTKTETGNSISIGFPVCKMTEFVGTDGVGFIVDAMNKHEAGHSGCFCPHCNPPIISEPKNMGAHIDANGQFQSDKYPTCPAGKVPLSVRDASAQDLLWQYAQRRRVVDAEFSDDLEAALKAAGYDWPKDMPAEVQGWDVGKAALALCQRLEHAGQQLPFEILKLEQDTAAIVIDQGGVDYILTMQVVPAQRPRQTKQ